MNGPDLFIPWTPDDIEQLVPDRFEQQVRSYGQRLAVKSWDAELSYDALNRAANRLAHALLERGSDETPIALLFEQGAAMIIALLGAMKAIRIYVPLATTDPQSRLKDILADAGARLIITNNNNLLLAEAVAQGQLLVLNLDDLPATLSEENPVRPARPVDNAIINIMYTSGSTGVPKGVMLTHRHMLHDVGMTTSFGRLTAQDRVLLLASYTVSVSTTSIGHALLNGGTVLPFDVKREGPAALAAWMKQEKATVYHSVPTVFRHLIGSLGEDDTFPAMRLLQLAGEPILKRDVELFRRHFPAHCLLRVGLGSTEAGLPTFLKITPEMELPETTVPLGRASPGREILILDENGAPVPEGETGEIAVKSRYLALGYWNKPEQTEAVFRPAPEGDGRRIYLTGDLGRWDPGGNLEHLGRKDLQVKIRGHRVEIPEIETRLLGIDGIREAAVVAKRDQRGDNRLVAYLVPTVQPAPAPATVRQALHAVLPEYMIPAAFVFMQHLPQGTFGKINRLALPTPDWEAVAAESVYAPPSTPVEELLAQLWSDVLGVHRVSIHAHFFDLGGDSLRAAQIIGRVGTIYGLDLPMTILFEAPTVAELALVIVQRLAENSEDDDIARLVTELEGS
ncbi:MAG: non-ribosomal peptide synthetase [Herpetosiphonaceae bacterium]|nr:non-ribosomal peptide synthetase [Herpetosiphonaceae bacterium]